MAKIYNDAQYIMSFSRFFVDIQVKITSFVSENQIIEYVVSGIITKWNKEYILEWFYYIKDNRANLCPSI